MKMKFIISIFIFCILIQPRVIAQNSSAIAVIVHKNNPVDVLTKSDVKLIFMKKNVRWQNESLIYPIDLPRDSKVRSTFSNDIVGKDVSIIMNYWNRQLFSGRQTPPVVKTKLEDVVALVTSNVDAIGYVPYDMVTEDIKVVEIIN